MTETSNTVILDAFGQIEDILKSILDTMKDMAEEHDAQVAFAANLFSTFAEVLEEIVAYIDDPKLAEVVEAKLVAWVMTERRDLDTDG